MRWTYDRPDRLGALADRAAEMADSLYRELVDAPRGSAARRLALLRLELVNKRLKRLRLLARVAKHNARVPA